MPYSSERYVIAFLLLFLCFVGSACGTSRFPQRESNASESAIWSSDRYRSAQPTTLYADLDETEVVPVESTVSETSAVTTSKCRKPDRNAVHLNFTTSLYESNYTRADDDDGYVFFPVYKRAIHPKDGPYTSSRVDLKVPVWPYAMIGKLYFTRISDELTAACSAAIIQRSLIVTAAHCVHDGKKGFNSNFRFAPGYVNGSAPFGMWLYEKVWASPSWTDKVSSWNVINGEGGKIPNEGDWALLQMKEQDDPKTGRKTSIGDMLGWFGYKTNSLKGNHVTSLGYPSNLDSGEQMHEVHSEYKRFRSPNMAEYPNDMEEGASGGPWIADFGVRSSSELGGESNQLVGIASYRDKDLTRRYLGSSIFNDKFVEMMGEACERSGNCLNP